MVAILGKTFPNKDQIQGRINSGAFDGVEIFVMDDILENPEKYRESMKLARDNFLFVNLETNWAVTMPEGKRMYGLMDNNPAIRARSRALLEATVALAGGDGNVNTHLVGVPTRAKIGVPNINNTNVIEQLDQTGEYLAQFNPNVTLENVIAFDCQQTPDVETANFFNIGTELGDFGFMYVKYGIPMTLDTAHLAINMAHYKRHVKNGSLLDSKGNNYELDLSPNRKQFAKSKISITRMMQNSINSLPYGSIRQLHFINATVDEQDQYKDGFPQFNAKEGRLINLDPILRTLSSRGDVEYLVAEVNDAWVTKTPDWVNVPYMVGMAKELRQKLTA